MKTLEEIDQMSVDLLEQVADDESVKAPKELADKVRQTIDVEEFLEPASTLSTAKVIRFAAPLVAVAAAVAIVVSLPSSSLKDTYDDPEMAYAELERTLSYISSKMTASVSMAMEAEANVTARVNEIIDEIK